MRALPVLSLLVVAMTVLTVISGYNNIRKNWDLLMNKK